MRFASITTFCIGLFALVSLGCSSKGPEGPPTVNAPGRVVIARGPTTEELFNRDSAIEFQSIDQPGVRAYGEIQPDGTFRLTTSKDGVRKNGVVEGQHRVRLMLDEQAVEQLAPGFAKFETSGLVAHVSGEQEIVLQVWR